MKNNQKSAKNRSGGGRDRGNTPGRNQDQSRAGSKNRRDDNRRFDKPKGQDRDKFRDDRTSQRGDSRPKRGGRGDERGGKPSFRPRHDEGARRPAREAREPRAPKAPRINHGPKPNLYGLHAVREAFLNPARTINALYLTEQAAELFAPVLEAAANEGLERPEPIVLPKDEFDRMLFRDSVHQGIAMAADPLEEVFVRDLVSIGGDKERSVIVVLDQVTDPHNVGAILRSACAFGATGVIMQRRHAPELDFIAAKTACGAVEHLPVAYETNLSRALELLAEEGYTAIGLDERGETTLGEMSVPDKCVLVLGAEGPGMRRLVREHCSVLVRLPTQEPIASLNVSNAAAVALYALVK